MRHSAFSSRPCNLRNEPLAHGIIIHKLGWVQPACFNRHFAKRKNLQGAVRTFRMWQCAQKRRTLLLRHSAHCFAGVSFQPTPMLDQILNVLDSVASMVLFSLQFPMGSYGSTILYSCFHHVPQLSGPRLHNTRANWSSSMGFMGYGH